MFRVSDTNEYTIMGVKEKNISTTLPAGLYSYKRVSIGFSINEELKRIERYKDSRRPKSGIFQEAVEYFDKFFDEDYKTIRKEMKMFNKLNVIFNGVPGSGKTHIACTLAEEYVAKYDAIGLVIDNINNVDFGKLIDDIRINDRDPNRLIVIVLDELEKNGYNNLTNSRFLGYLDGAESRENVITIATSNDISSLPGFLINRKGRFEKKWDFSFKDSPDTIRETSITLNPSLEDKKELLDNIVTNCISLEIETVDDLRFLILETIFEFNKTGNLNTDIEKEVKENKKELSIPEKIKKFTKDYNEKLQHSFCLDVEEIQDLEDSIITSLQ